MLKLRRFEDTDAAAVWELHNLALHEVGAHAGNGPWDDDIKSIRASYLEEGGEFLVGLANQRVVAMGAVRRLNDSMAEIKRMRVHPSFQRRGFGRLVLGQLERRAAELGYRTLRLDTTVGQTGAQCLYRSAGYEEIGRGQFAGFDVIFFEKMLVPAMDIRPIQDSDWEQIYPFFSAIIAAGETYAYEENLSSEAARAFWVATPPGQTVVAVDGDTVLGTASMGPNRDGRGAHIATASFMVDAAQQGRGVGRALGEYVVAWARDAGFRGIQFNAVVETNRAAVRLWQSLGFEILATVPEAYKHRRHGYVGLHVMYRPLAGDSEPREPAP
jgi:ribosomal protein S18 acetylase RimI-like enzyme